MPLTRALWLASLLLAACGSNSGSLALTLAPLTGPMDLSKSTFYVDLFRNPRSDGSALSCDDFLRNRLSPRDPQLVLEGQATFALDMHRSLPIATGTALVVYVEAHDDHNAIQAAGCSGTSSSADGQTLTVPTYGAVDHNHDCLIGQFMLPTGPAPGPDANDNAPVANPTCGS